MNPPNVRAVQTLKDHQKLLAAVGQAEIVALDTETDRLDIVGNEFILAGLCLSIDPGLGYYYPFQHLELRREEKVFDTPEGLIREVVIADPEEWIRSPGQLDPEQVLGDYSRALTGKKLVFHNAKFDLHALFPSGIRPREIFWDTQLAAWILDHRERQSLKWQIRRHFKYEPLEYDAVVFGTSRIKKNKNFRQVPIDLAVRYAAADPANTLRLFRHQRPRLSKDEKLLRIFQEVELPLIPVIAAVERVGISLDARYLRELHVRVATEMDRAEADMKEAVGYEFAVSGKGSQLARQQAFFADPPDGLGIPIAARSRKTLKPTLDKGAVGTMDDNINKWLHESRQDLEACRRQFGKAVDLVWVNQAISRRCERLKSAGADPIDQADGRTLSRLAEKLEEDVLLGARREKFLRAFRIWQKLAKIASTYTLALIDRTGDDRRLHTNFKQSGTDSGRMSSENPNWQNIPRSDEKAFEYLDVRKAFVGDPGFVFIVADYSAMEMRIAAMVSGCPVLSDIIMGRRKDARGRDIDIHLYTASHILKSEYDHVADVFYDPEHADHKIVKRARQAAKPVNFGILYGISEIGLASQLKIPVPSAKEFIQGFMNAYPGVARWLLTIEGHIRTQFYSETVMGRRRLVSEESKKSRGLMNHEVRACTNHVIQGTAADVTKIAMRRIHEALKAQKLRARMCSTVHDEIITLCHHECVLAVKKLQTELMFMSHAGIDLPAEAAVKTSFSKHAPDLTPAFENGSYQPESFL